MLDFLLRSSSRADNERAREYTAGTLAKTVISYKDEYHVYYL